jgi:FkbM family methyltransferase
MNKPTLRRIKLLCKKAGWKILPRSAVQFIRKRYYLRLSRSWSPQEEADLQVVRYLVRPADYVIDIGANIGLYSKVLSELVGPDGRVYSVEPFPSTYEILSYNISKLHLENVEPLNVAISDSQTVVTMVLPYDPSGAETHYRASVVKAHICRNKTQTAKVEATTIDSMFLSVSKMISFVKCDVEGHELPCIQGARNFLAQSKAAWLIEVSQDPDSADSAAHRLFEILSNTDYTAWWFDGSKLRKRRPGDRSTNYFFLKEAHIDAVKELLAV